MNLLAVDTSGPVAGVAVLRGGRVAYEGAADGGMNHSVSLMPMVEEALTRSGLDIAEVDLFAAVTGPGSFTGVRIGVSTIKGMAHGTGKPCVGIDALEALAAGISMRDTLICPILDARAGQVYGAAFAAGFPPVRKLGGMAVKLPEYVDHILAAADEQMALKGSKMPFCFVGDGVETYQEALRETLGKRALFLPAHLSFLRPASVGMLAQVYADKAVDYLSLQPQYLRAPQAERERKARLQEMQEAGAAKR